MDDLSHETKTTRVLARKFAVHGDGMVQGYAAIFSETDLDGEVFEPFAFSASLAELKSAGFKLPLLWQHRPSEPIGSWHNLTEDRTGLLAVGQINTDVARGKEALSLIMRGDLSGLSVGFRSTARRGPVIQVAQLHEISVVSIPAAPKARVRLKDFDSLPALAQALAEGQPLARKDAEFLARKGWTDRDDDDAMRRLAETIRAARLTLRKDLP